MNGTAEIRLRAIHSRARRYRARSEVRRLGGLTACGLLLLTGTILLLNGAQSPGVAAVADGYGAVLLRDGAEAYVVVGLLAFALGVLATLLCVRMKNSAAKRMQIDDEEWNRGGDQYEGDEEYKEMVHCAGSAGAAAHPQRGDGRYVILRNMRRMARC